VGRKRLKRIWQLGLGLSLTAGAACFAQTTPQSNQLRQTALTLEQQGRNAEAEIAWHGYLKAHPNSAEPYGHLGLLEARQGRYKEAIAYYRRALAIKPDVPGLRLNFALALFKSGDLKAAIPEFTALLKNAPPDSPEAQRLTILIGMSHYGLAQYEAAAPFLKQGADRDPQNLPLRLALAHSYLWSGQSKNVLDVYREILTINADSAEADMLAGEALDQMKDTAGAIEMFRNAVKANPKEPNVHFGLGYLLWTQKNYPEAESEFKAELANDPDHLQAMVYLADAYIQMNRFHEAQPLLEKAVQVDSSASLARLDLGIVYTEADRKEDALRELTEAAKLSPADVNVHWRLGRLYRSLGRKDEAKAEFDKASSLNKAADEDLYKKIAAGKFKPPEAQALPPTTSDQ
jgi:tetratricopeptide (TPR) repeat protein